MGALVVDIGGSHVKLLATGIKRPRRSASHPSLGPEDLVEIVRSKTKDWRYDRVSIGFPGVTGPTGPEEEPGNLGSGWVGFDFAAAFGLPVRIVNDAVLQALGGYQSGRMLFLGLGTGLGSALVTERVLVPLELGCLRYDVGETLGDRLGKEGLEKHGERAWAETLAGATAELRKAFRADEILLGGGHVDRLDPLPAGCRRGGNHDAFTGGFRLWEDWVEQHEEPLPKVWRVVR